MPGATILAFCTVCIPLHAFLGLAALQLLRNEQLSAAVDNLVTEDFAELGVNDRGREIRSIVDDIIRVSTAWVFCTLLNSIGSMNAAASTAEQVVVLGSHCSVIHGRQKKRFTARQGYMDSLHGNVCHMHFQQLLRT